MRRETKFKLAALQVRLIESIPFVFIGAAVIGLVWMILSWSKKQRNEVPFERDPYEQTTP